MNNVSRSLFGHSATLLARKFMTIFIILLKVGMGQSIKFLKETKAGRLLVVVNRCLLAFTMHVS
jgi:hypothetical protein